MTKCITRDAFGQEVTPYSQIWREFSRLATLGVLVQVFAIVLLPFAIGMLVRSWALARAAVP